MEKSLQELHASLASSPSAGSLSLFRSTHQSVISPNPAPSSSAAGRDSYSCSPLAAEFQAVHPQHPAQQQHRDSHHPPTRRPRQRSLGSEPSPPNNLENAVLDSMHTSTTESVLQWPHFDVFPSLRHNYVTIFHLEQARPPFRTRPMSMCPYASPQEVDAVFSAFEHGVNFWYPTVSRAQLKAMRGVMLDASGAQFEAGGAGETLRCLALLTMALGCASQVIGGLAEGAAMGEAEWERRRARREVGDRYFDCVMRMLHVAHTDVSPAATHCLLFVA